MKIPRANGGNYCDAGAPLGHQDYCDTWIYPDGYTDAAYINPAQILCLYQKYQNPTFTLPTISIFPPMVVGQDPVQSFWLYPETWPCIVVPPSPPERKSKHANQENKPFGVYPVPSSDNVYVVNAVAGNYVYIYNMVGKVIQVEEIKSEEHELDISQLAAGIYYIRSGTEGNAVKIVKTGY